MDPIPQYSNVVMVQLIRTEFVFAAAPGTRAWTKDRIILC